MTNPLAYQPAPAAPSMPPPHRREGPSVGIAWAAIILSVALVFGGNLLMTFGPADKIAPTAATADDVADPSKVRSIELESVGRSAVGMQLLGNDNKVAPATGPAATQPAGGADRLFDGQVREAAKTPLERLRATALIGELDGSTAAVDWLRALRADKPDAALDRDAEQLLGVYLAGPESIDATSRADLIRRHGWFARLALSSGKPDADPERHAVLAPARRAAWTNVAAIVVLGGGAIASVAFFLVALIRLFSGGVRRAYAEPIYAHPALAAAAPPLYPPHLAPFAPWAAPISYETPPAPDAASAVASDRDAGVRTGPFLEMFALYLAGQIALSLGLLWLASRHRLQLQWLMFPVLPAVFLWPLARGVSWADLRRGLGWHAGQGVLREVGAGLAGYLAGLPVALLGIGLTYLITRLTGAQASHPIGDEIGGAWANVQIVLLACVWAPIVEESMFRGALFHHLRRRHGWWLSALVSALIFAAIHPQGLAGIPALMGLAIVFAAIREWRGSLIGPVAAHFLNNGIIVAALLLTLG